MKPKEKQAVMDAFKAGELAVLVATTVIEVGVDVPNASLMVIENSERSAWPSCISCAAGSGAARWHPTACCCTSRRWASWRASGCRSCARPTTASASRKRIWSCAAPVKCLARARPVSCSFRIADLARDAHLLPAVQQVGEHMLQADPRQTVRLIARWIGAAARYAHA